MIRTIQIVIICCCCFSSSILSAQLNEYIESENNRILISEKTEIEIESFIKQNFNNYKLSKENTAHIIGHLRKEENFTDAELEVAMVNAKKHELRKLFFAKNPDKKENYIAPPVPFSVSELCANGDFESGTAGYSFWSDMHAQPQSGTNFFMSCATPTALSATNVMTPTTNNFNSRVTVINSAASGYQQFDPVLAGLGVNVPTLNTNGGNRCVKLNNQGGFGSSDLSSMSRSFTTINQPTIDFNFSLVMDNKPQHGQDIQPYFRVRAYDQNNNVVDEICIIANPENCLFNIIYVNDERRVLYTGWICARLNVGEILNQPGRIEFSVSDCQPSAHFGTVYIDNICGLVCANPQLGALNLNPEQYNCPDIYNNTPIEVCGTYQPPVNATLSTLVLDIVQNGTVVGTINAPTQLTATTFCFSVAPGLFGTNPSGDFEFQIHANFETNCPAGTFIYEISDYSSAIGPDVTFINCCTPTLTLTSPADDTDNLAPLIVKQRERSDWIKASNVIAVGDNALSNGVVYHAENYVELNPGFEAVLGAQFAAYPEGCTENFLYRQPNETTSSQVQEIFEIDTINLIQLSGSFAIVPNPSSSTIELVMKDAKFNKVEIISIDGKLVFNKTFETTDKVKIDISDYKEGVYIVNIASENGQSLSEKLVKN